MADSKTTVSDSQDDKTGHKLELSEASTKLAEAVVAGDPVALRLAADAHATALNSQATAMAASIAAPVYTQLAEIKELFTTQIEQGKAQMRQERSYADQQASITRAWLEDEKVRRNNQADRFIAELNQLPATMQEVVATELGKVLPRIDGLEAGMSELAGIINDQGEQIDHITDRLIVVEATPGTSPDIAQKIAHLSNRITIMFYAVGFLVLLWVLILIATALR